MDNALKRKMAQEFSGIEQTTFWNEYQKALYVQRRYAAQTLEKSEKEWELARAQGGIFAYEKVFRIPKELTGIENPQKDKE